MSDLPTGNHSKNVRVVSSDVREGIAWLELKPDPWRHSAAVIEAASRWADLLDQEPIDWCAEHRSAADKDLPDMCEYSFPIALAADECRMVRVRLAQEEPQ